MDISKLGVRFDTSQARRAKDDMRGFREESGRAAESARRLGADQTESARQQVTSINELNERIEHLGRLRDQANSTEQVRSYNREIGDLTNRKNELQRQGQQVNRSTDRMNKLFRVGAGLIAGYFSIRTLRRIVDMATQTAKFADEIDKMNERTGIGVERLQELRFVTDQTGVSFESIESAVDSFTRRIPRIETGSGRAADVMGQLGVRLRDSSGEMRNMGDLIPEIITSLSEMENRTERNALAQELLGRNSSDLIPLLNAEEGEIRELTERYREMGLAMDENAIQKAVDYKDSMSEMQAQTEALRNDFGLLILELNEDYNVLPWIQETIANTRNLNERFQNMRDHLSDLRGDLDQSSRANEGFAQSFVEVANQVRNKLEAGDLSIEQEEELNRVLGKNREAILERKNALEEELSVAEQNRDAVEEQVHWLEENIRWIDRMPGPADTRIDELERGQKRLEQFDLAIENHRAMVEALEEAYERSFAELEDGEPVTDDFIDSARRADEAIEALRGRIDEPIENIFDPAEEDRIRRIREEFEQFSSVLGDLEEMDIDTSLMAEPGSIRFMEEAVQDLNRRFMETTDATERAFVKERIEEYREEIRKLKGETEKQNREIEEQSALARDLGFTFESAAEQAIVAWSGFGDFMEALFRDLRRIAARRLIIEPASDAFSDLLSGVDFSGGSTVDMVNVEPRAKGGPTMAGKTYLVGEEGPELWTANQPGNVTPNNKMGGGVTVNVNVRNEGGSEVDVEQRTNSNGNIDLDIMVREKVKDLFNRGQMDSTMNRNFGVNRKAVRRG